MLGSEYSHQRWEGGSKEGRCEVSLCASWTALGDATDLPKPVRPHVRICTSTASQLEEKSFRSRLQLIECYRQFADVNLDRLQFGSTYFKYKALREALVSDCLKARHTRQAHHVLFAAHHMSWFFAKATEHVAETISKPFDFFEASRLHRPLPADYSDRLRGFIKLAISHRIPSAAIQAAIASSVILDAYPVTAHRKPCCETRRGEKPSLTET